ncbi:MAG: hypothetical protein KF744_06975 [Taibaiella sp.]|nr:hypothetical protein [Taibaiella sp.]
MKIEFVAYLEKVGIIDGLLEKAKEVLDFYEGYLKVDVTDVFVSEYLSSDGSRNYESLWIFSKQYCGEAKFFLKEKDWDLDTIANNVSYFSVKCVDFSFGKDALSSSRVTLEFGFVPSNRNATLKASKENCEQIANILAKYVSANVYRPN